MPAPLSPGTKRSLIAAATLTGLLGGYAPFAVAVALGGGVLGQALLWGIPVIAFSAAWLAARAWTGTAEHRYPRAAVMILLALTLGTGVFSAISEIRGQISNPLQRLASGPVVAPFSGTRIIFRCNGNEMTIVDPFSRLRFRHGTEPVSIKVASGVRTIVFDQPVVLKSWSDSLTLDSNGATIGGWMGARINPDRTRLKVDDRGRILAETIR